MVFGRPLRGWSSRPAIPLAANRSRHLITVGRDTSRARAVAVVPEPSATANTILARSTDPAERVDERNQDSNSARSSSLKANPGADPLKISPRAMSSN
ncbi:hypothetical protein Acsp07_09490 [Actinomycetospora sp. NBRC 106378]|nr:hypothetical protein Acsp07_09490 [Actinomycetospora sp. NBRC 106378]